MAGIAGLYLNSPSGKKPSLLRRARSLLDEVRAAWAEADGQVALGHESVSGSSPETSPQFAETSRIEVCGREPASTARLSSRVGSSPETGVLLALDGDVFEQGGRSIESPGRVLDTLLAAYLEDGLRFLDGLRGIFSLALYDPREGRDSVVLACDRWGMLPLFHAEVPGGFAFSSRLGRLLQSGLFKPSPDVEAAAGFFTFSYILGDATLFQGVKSVPPGSVLVRHRGQTRVSTYWSFDCPADMAAWDAPSGGGSAGGRHRALEDIRERFLRAVEIQTADRDKLGMGLTGKIDSRAIAAALKKLGRKITTVTHSVTQATDERIAAKVSRVCGFPHRWLKIEGESLAQHVPRLVELTGGLIGTLEPHPLSLLPALAEVGGIFLTGGGGEFGRGFFAPRAKDRALPADSSGVARYLYRKIADAFSDSPELNRFLRLPAYRNLPDLAWEHVARAVGEMPQELSSFRKLDLFYLTQRLRKFLLVKGTMVARSAVEVRYPFLDYELMDLVWRAPEALKRDSSIHKHLVVNLYRPLGRIPSARTGFPLHASLLGRVVRVAKRKSKTALYRASGKERFRSGPRPSFLYPLWMRGSLGRCLASVLMEERTLDRGIFDGSAVRILLDDHWSGVRDASAEIQRLAAYELALRLPE
jgi:asparagine synthase (glutamine-hydrolysing)